MTKTTHTPGPWEWRHGAFPDEYRLAPGVLITEGADGTPWGDEIDRANAALIEAAPDMLAALEAALNEYEQAEDFAHPVAKSIRAAIAKAKGIK